MMQYWQEKSASHLGLASFPGEARAETLRDGAKGSTFQTLLSTESGGPLAKMITFPGPCLGQLENNRAGFPPLVQEYKLLPAQTAPHPNLSPSRTQAQLHIARPVGDVNPLTAPSQDTTLCICLLLL